MSKVKKEHIRGLNIDLANYAKKRQLEFSQYSPYHMRIMDGGYVVLDVWTTGRYYILTTDYAELVPGAVERGGEKGSLPRLGIRWLFLDSIFFPEIENE